MNIGHFKTNMMLSALRVLFQKLGNRAILTQWLDQFDLTVGRINERSEEHTSELQSLMRISYAVFCLKKKKTKKHTETTQKQHTGILIANETYYITSNYLH